MIKLIASDMDGTLVTGHIEISEFTANAVKKAQAMGIKFVAATGRNYQEASTPLKQAGITADIIGVNGAAIFTADGECLETNPIGKEDAAKLLQLFHEHGIYAEIATNQGVFGESQSQRIEYFAEHIAEMMPHMTFKQALAMAATKMQFFHITYVKQLSEVIKRDGVDVLKFFLISADGEKSFAPLREALNREFNNIALTSSGKYNIEINHINAQKGIIVRNLAEEMGIAPEEVMTIGDSYNDISMLEYAGVSFAMENANDDIKKVAKYQTTSNDDDGVGKAILRAIEENL